jgi:hypothetical protein
MDLTSIMYELIVKLTKYFEDNDFFWNVGGKYISPTESDFEKMLLKCAGTLEVGDQIETGRLIVSRDEHGYVVYVYAGEFE